MAVLILSLFFNFVFPPNWKKKMEHQQGGSPTLPVQLAQSFRLLAFNSHLTSWRWQLKTRLLSTTWMPTSILGTSE